MKTNIISIVITIFSLIIFQKCTFFKSKESQKIVSQELLYDSINKKEKIFNVYLTTIIEFKNRDFKNNNFTNLSLIVNKDTLLLIPEINSRKIDIETNTMLIRFSTKTNFTSKVYKNDTLANKVLNSRVINDNSETIEKDDSFEMKTLILGYPSKKNGLKFE